VPSSWKFERIRKQHPRNLRAFRFLLRELDRGAGSNRPCFAPNRRPRGIGEIAAFPSGPWSAPDRSIVEPGSVRSLGEHPRSASADGAE
jgi:hypothetical protein